jgi:lactate 2-monooxygenase
LHGDGELNRSVDLDCVWRAVVANRSRVRQTRLYLDGFAGKYPAIPLTPQLLEQQALRKLSARAGGYLAGGAGAERTMAANREAFDRYRIVQRVLRDVKNRDLSVELFGQRLPLPMLLAPIGVLELAHRDADLAAARAAAAAEGIPFVASSQASYPLEQIARANGNGCRWFQLYWSARDEIARSFVARAEAAGYSALVVTVDTTELGWRPRDLNRGYLPFMAGRGIANYVSDPVFMKIEAEDDGLQGMRPAVRFGLIRSVLELLGSWPEGALKGLRSGPGMVRTIRKFVALYSRPGLTWDDLPRLREWTRLPILLKGIVHPDDARRALELGVDGVIVSNHGGRQVDGAIGALDALPRVVDAIDGAIPVLFDSGIRTGADIIKALALGARAVLVGRPYAYGLALGGEGGVRAVIANLAADLDANLGLSGHRTLSELDRRILADC